MSESFEAWTAAAKMAYLKEGYDALAAREALWTRRLQRGEKQRKAIFIFGACVFLIAVIALSIGAYLVYSRGPARDYNNRQFQNLACLSVMHVPDNANNAAAVRAQYHCPPFRPLPGR